ncbi:MAG: TolC family protein [Methylococcaceae bacterium]
MISYSRFFILWLLASASDVCSATSELEFPPQINELAPANSTKPPVKKIASRLRETPPVETRVRETAPVEVRQKETPPVETRVRETAPLEARQKESRPVELSPGSYQEELRGLLESHRRIVAARSDVSAGESSLSGAKGGWYPNVKATVNYGYEDRAGAKFNPNSNDFTLDQLLWNFGATNSAIKKADLSLQKSHVAYETERQGLLLEGLTAYINLFKAYRTLEFAQKNVDNIRKQTGMEEDKVELGSGLPTDVLQAKSQLAGALARQIRGEGALLSAENRYRNVFSQSPPQEITEIKAPMALLPTSLEAALEMAHERNYDLRTAKITSQIAHTEVNRVRSSGLFPEIKMVGQGNFRNNANGIKGQWDNYLAKVEATYSFNLGLTQIHSIDAAQSSAIASDYRLQDTVLKVEEEIRNAWQALHTAMRNAEQLKNQARIASEFLRLAREERQLGHRSLIDVLTGETSLINAESDAVSADADVTIAAFTLFKAISSLDIELVK